MVEITAAMVKALREKTDAPMMECKKALTEAAGDLVRAEEVLRIKLGSKANKASSRVTAEGLIGLIIEADGKSGAIVEVNCETDFVAKNEDFIGFAQDVAGLVTANAPADIAALSALPLGEGTVESTRAVLVGKIGENIAIRRFKRMATEHSLASYVHGGKIGVLVDFAGDPDIGKDLAMHIAATKPRAIDETGVPEADKEAERSVARQKAAASGKPPEIVEKMVEGSVQKYLKEVALLSQLFVKNDKQTVGQMLKEKGASVKHFEIFIVGEGIEKKVADHAAEVAAAASGNA